MPDSQEALKIQQRGSEREKSYKDRMADIIQFPLGGTRKCIEDLFNAVAEENSMVIIEDIYNEIPKEEILNILENTDLNEISEEMRYCIFLDTEPEIVEAFIKANEKSIEKSRDWLATYKDRTSGNPRSHHN